jgi:hypothetical protein
VIGGLVVGVVVLLVVFTGFVAPGFFRNDDEAGGTAPASAPASSQDDPSADPSTGPTDSTSPGGDAPRLTEAVTMATKFVGYLNANNQKAAAAMGCEGSKELLPTVISLVVDDQTALKVTGPATVEEPGTTAYPMRMDVVPIGGKIKFGPTTGYVRLEDVSGQALCVRLFQTK